MKVRYIVLICTVIIFVAVTTYFIAQIFINNSNTINLNQIDNIHYKYILSAMIDLKPAYVDKINKITFSANRSFIRSKCGSDAGSRLAGCHSYDNRIFVWVSDAEDDFRTILCHEILHEVIDIESESEEEIVYMIDDSGICFNSNKFTVDLIDISIDSREIWISNTWEDLIYYNGGVDYGRGESSENLLRWS